MKRPVFLDTSYILALVNTKDRLHPAARKLSEAFFNPVVTTEAVLTEIGNSLCKVQWRSLGAEVIGDLRNDPETEIIPVSSELFSGGLELYTDRTDKEWSLTDCISFVVMKAYKLTEALTSDHHFRQAGFNVLLDK
jgi:predicted nucleic acid-binding protein